jgi:transposase InsO family protein
MLMGNRNYFTPYFTKTKDAAYPKIKEYFTMVDRQHGKDFIRRFRSDNEFSNNNMLKNFFQTEGIITEFSTPHNPSQNGRAERFNLTVMNMARAMLIESGLPLSFWEYAVRNATYILNRLSSKSYQLQRSGYERKN